MFFQDVTYNEKSLYFHSAVLKVCSSTGNIFYVYFYHYYVKTIEGSFPLKVCISYW